MQLRLTLTYGKPPLIFTTSNAGLTQQLVCSWSPDIGLLLSKHTNSISIKVGTFSKLQCKHLNYSGNEDIKPYSCNTCWNIHWFSRKLGCLDVSMFQYIPLFWWYLQTYENHPGREHWCSPILSQMLHEQMFLFFFCWFSFVVFGIDAPTANPAVTQTHLTTDHSFYLFFCSSDMNWCLNSTLHNRI